MVLIILIQLSTEKWISTCQTLLLLHVQKTHSEQETHCNALPHDAGLLHAARPTKLLHVFTEVALSTLRPEARLTLPTASPPPPGTRCSPTGWQLDCWCRRSCHLRFRPVGRPGLKGLRGYNVKYLKVRYLSNKHLKTKCINKKNNYKCYTATYMHVT